ncbi:sensor histidine kinase [Caulobacter mirabilis]|uniref:histidine kinase n=1 Tax=Caulobacter mirabilis TaxID=69666 RepID=A0A2D2AXZ8_9CAUL|nr:HAMP domain-containing sensor histidine kinase [Caulobacter mirabilis]ATQ42890.1 hypothetical protein CSW64_10945 [Caulobacter mirabilis]
MGAVRGALRPRAVLVVMVAVALVALAAGLLVIDRIGETLIDQRQQAVAEAARDYFVAFAHEEGLAPLAKALDLRERTRPAGGGFRYAVYDAEGRFLGGARLADAEDLPAQGRARIRLLTPGKHSPWQVLVQPLSVGGTLVVYENIHERAAFRRALIVSGAIALVGALGALLACGLWFNRQLLRRIEAVAGTAERIADGDLAARAPAAPQGDVFDRLGLSLNAMLDRIEALMTGMRTVTDSLAHDLRSPLTRLRADIARAAEPGLSEVSRSRALVAAQGEAERALATLSALMDIARAEAGLSSEMMAPVDLAGLIADLGELFGPVIEDAGQTFTVAPWSAPLVVQGHELLLRQAVGNLLHNAALHAGPGAAVSLALEEDEDGVRIIVQDRGRGVPAEHRGRVQERFVRLDSARTTPGAGLGLAIAAACARLHGGVLDLQDAEPGLRAVIGLRRHGRFTARTEAG